MEPHELALAALNEVVESHSATLASSRSRIAGNDMVSLMTNNKLVNNAASTHQPSLHASQSLPAMFNAAGSINESQAPESSQKLSSTLNSQGTSDSHDAISTPPTSTSEGFSSQSTNQDGLSQLSELAANVARPSLTVAPTAGHKRTADGRLKANSNSPISPVARGHSRNVSSVSNVSSVASSKIGELSSELRTRLSYAMIKVNNGWQSHSIDEVESLASQGGSPTSSSSTLHGRRTIITSPRTAMIASMGHNRVQAPTGDFDLYSRHDQPSRTYESFWRDHSSSNYPTNRNPGYISAASPPSRSLGPAADIRPAVSSRRSGTPKFSKPPGLPSQGSHSSNSPYHTPRTPHRGEYRDTTAIQTPSQKTLQEQDAIETLLFMSSPGNSGNMNHAFPPPRTQASPQQSPLRSEFNARPRSSHGRKVAFDAAAAMASSMATEAIGPVYRSKIHGKGPGRDKARSEAIDRMLDDLEDSSSDEDLISHSTSRGIAAAGR